MPTDRITPPSTVVIVDDAFLVVRSASLFLTTAGHRAVEEQRGDRVLATVFGTTPDLVIIDVAMVPTDGHTLCRAIKDRYQEDVTVMLSVISTEAHQQSNERAVAAGVDGWLMKPFTKDDLLAAVDNAWHQRHQRSVRALHGALDDASGPSPGTPPAPRRRL